MFPGPPGNCDRRALVEKNANRCAGAGAFKLRAVNSILKVLEDGGNWNPGIAKHPCTADLAGNTFLGRALRPIEGASAAGGFRKCVEGFREQLVHVVKLPALDAFPHAAFKLRLVNFDAHGFPALNSKCGVCKEAGPQAAALMCAILDRD